jgi:modulator of FtsH protease HflC
MMERRVSNPLGLGILAAAGLVAFLATVSFVPETRQGVVVRFGEPVRIINRYKPNEVFGRTGAGMIVRMPFAEQVEWIDKRVQSIDMEEQEVLSTDQLRLEVDAYARYRIVDPLKMFKAVGTEARLTDALRPLLGNALRNELGKQTFASLLTAERGKVMRNIQTGLNRTAAPYGAQIIDVRIKRADLPKGTPLDSAFERMRTARQQEAITKRAEGQKQAQIIMATADAEAAKTYAASFGKDPGFYDFYRAMQSYRLTFGTDGNKADGSASIVMSPNNDYLRQFRGGGQ